MKQISPYDFYMLGRVVEPLFELREDTRVNDGGVEAMLAFKQLREAANCYTILLPATRAALEKLTDLLVKVFGDGVQQGLPVFWNEYSSATLGSSAVDVREAAKEFDTVFRLQSPRMPVFAVEKKGLYEVYGLVDGAEDHLPETVRVRLPDQARVDIAAAGRCLAFSIPTATAFHVWRALETVIGAYYVALTGQTFAEAQPKVQRNWGDYIKALVASGADKKITTNLDHIRSEHRNPVMHPNHNVTADQAFSLLGIGYSAITQVMQAIEALPDAEKALARTDLLEVTLEV